MQLSYAPGDGLTVEFVVGHAVRENKVRRHRRGRAFWLSAIEETLRQLDDEVRALRATRICAKGNHRITCIPRGACRRRRARVLNKKTFETVAPATTTAATRIA